MSLVTVNGIAANVARAQIPAWGCWWLDVDLTEDPELSGSVEIDFAGTAMAGTVVSGGSFDGRSAYRIAGGAAGWGTEVAAKGYRDDAGVKLSTVLSDATRSAGETISGAPSTRLGSHYARSQGPASRVLHELAPRGWYVDLDGTTVVGTRAAVALTGTDPKTRVDLRAGVVEYAVEAVAEYLPGLQVEDLPDPASDVEWELRGDRLTARVYSAPHLSRRLAAFAAIFDALDPRRLYRGTFEFRVVSQSGERLNLQPVRAATGLPDLAGVPVRPGMAGLKATAQPGSLVLVTFVDSDPSRPAVIAHDSPDAPGWAPLLLEIGAAPTLPAARQTDQVQAGPFGGPILGGSATVKVGG